MKYSDGKIVTGSGYVTERIFDFGPYAFSSVRGEVISMIY